MIQLNEVIKSYGPGGKRALDGVSLSIPQGEIVGLFGENGAGKTTLLKCILGLLRYQGTITLDGEPITGKNIARLSFATCEHSFFPGLTAEDHRIFYRAPLSRLPGQAVPGADGVFRASLRKAPASLLHRPEKPV